MTCEDIDAPCNQCVYCDNSPFSIPCKDCGFTFQRFIKKEDGKMENIFKLNTAQNITQEEIDEVRIFMNEKKQELASKGHFKSQL